MRSPLAECVLSVGLPVEAGESDRFFFPWPYQPHQCFCETVGGTLAAVCRSRCKATSETVSGLRWDLGGSFLTTSDSYYFSITRNTERVALRRLLPEDDQVNFVLGGSPCVPKVGLVLHRTAGFAEIPLRTNAHQFVVPHNLYLTMFSPSSVLHMHPPATLACYPVPSHLWPPGVRQPLPLQVNVMPFDPQRGADHARAYATKYASKPETVGG